MAWWSRIALVLGFVIVIRPVITTAQDAGPELVRTIEGISEYQFDNGLKVLLFPDKSKPTVTINLTVFVGSRHEGYGEAGMAHLLEHMLFKGTPDNPGIPRSLKDRGADFNGTTWLDRTNYYETLPSSGDNLEFAIRLEADRMVNSLIRAEDLESEMTVVRNEFERGENSPSSILRQRMMATAFEWHNYGKSTIGNRADIERVPIVNLRRFYEKYYQPDNAMLVVAGSFETDAALALTTKYFGSIPRPERVLEQTYTEEPAQDGERVVTLRRVGDVAVVGALYHIPSGPHPDYAPIDVLESVMTMDPAGRLYKSLVETRRAANVYGSAYALHDPGVLMFIAEVAQGNNPGDVGAVMIEVLESAAAEEITEEEVERAKRKLLKLRELSTSESRRIAIELSEWAAQGDWRLYFIYRDRLEQVTVEDVRRVAAEYLEQSNRTVGIFMPTTEPARSTIPATPELAGMIGDYQGREDVAEGEAFDVSPDNIESRTKRFVLQSGVKVAALPKSTRGETVNVRLTLNYGDPDTLTGRRLEADFLPSLMMRGTKSLTRQKIRDELDRLRSRIGASGSAGSVTFTIKCRRAVLDETLAILQQILREPTFPADELELIRQAQVAQLEQQLTDPTSLAMNTVNRIINPYAVDDPRYIPTFEEQLESIKSVQAEPIRDLYQNQLSGENGELALVGDFDVDAVTKTFEAMLDGWKSGHPYERIVRNGDVPLKQETLEVLTPDKANATLFSGTVFPMRDDNPDYAALAVGNSIFGGGALSSRLGDRVRQQEGLSYSIGTGLRASSQDLRTTFYIYAITNPDNINKLTTAIDEETARIRQDGVTTDELTNAKEGYLQQRAVSRTDDSSLAAILASTLTTDRTMEFTAQQEQSIRDLTTDAVNAALRKYLQPDKLVTAIAGDLKKTPASGEKPSANSEKPANE